MKYIGYAGINNIDHHAEWASDIALASLISPNFYDYGELSLHPIMKSLNEHENEWLLKIVQTYIEANLKNYHSIMKQYEKNIDQHPLLKPNYDIMNEKNTIINYSSFSI